MQLLVSPSSIEEAKRSFAADIIDIKKPSEGSLGANFPWVIKEIKSFSPKPVSAAIGDFDFKPGGAALAAYGAACAGADYVKIGLMFDGEAELSNLSGPLKAVKTEFPEEICCYCSIFRLRTARNHLTGSPVAASGRRRGRSRDDRYREKKTGRGTSRS
jgi:uncharacterized protein (UPF0264 family)